MLQVAVKLADFFDAKPARRLPAIARRWEGLLAQTAAKQLGVAFERERDGLSFEPAQLAVSFIGGIQQVPRELVAWDLRLDDWLLDHGACAFDDKNEGERFGYRLREELEAAEQRVGSGFFNSVLVWYLKQTELANQRPIRSMLASAHAYRHADSEGARDCAASIEQSIVASAQALTNKLHYPRPKAMEILVAAIAYYLDERFNITTRKLLGVG